MNMGFIIYFILGRSNCWDGHSSTELDVTVLKAPVIPLQRVSRHILYVIIFLCRVSRDTDYMSLQTYSRDISMNWISIASLLTKTLLINIFRTLCLESLFSWFSKCESWTVGLTTTHNQLGIMIVCDKSYLKNFWDEIQKFVFQEVFQVI